MKKWFEHEWMFYNLDKFSQICLGNDDEILISSDTHNMEWDDEEKYCVLKYKSKEERDLDYEKIRKLLIGE